MKFIINNIVLVVFSFLAVTAAGQEYRIEVVNIEGQPIEKVLVIDEDNKTIGATDVNGLYIIVPPAHGHDIRLNKIGYHKITQ
jgi:hypothetical protein